MGVAMITTVRVVERYQCIRDIGPDGQPVDSDPTVRRWMQQTTLNDGVIVGSIWVALKDRLQSSFASISDLFTITDDDLVTPP